MGAEDVALSWVSWPEVKDPIAEVAFVGMASCALHCVLCWKEYCEVDLLIG